MIEITEEIVQNLKDWKLQIILFFMAVGLQFYFLANSIFSRGRCLHDCQAKYMLILIGEITAIKGK